MTEVAVVLSLIGIMTAISVPSYISWLPRHKLQTSVRQIYDDMQLAKIRAIKDNSVAVIIFTPSTNQYTIFLDAVPTNLIWNPGETIIKQNVSLQNGVTIAGTTLAGHACGFNNRGMLPPSAGPGVVKLTNPTNLLMGVEVMNTAGGIRIVTSTDGWASWS
jgi:Tfp pilus assembly protein FimT